MNHTICHTPGCPNEGRYCRIHPGAHLESVKPIAPLSKKRRKIQQKEYGPAAKAFLKAHPVCQIKAAGCTSAAQGVHHLVGRVGDKLLDQAYWLAACNHCNGFVEKNDAWARANGFKLSKFSPELNK